MNKRIAKARKNNMKLHPIYQMIGLDLLFFYGIKVLFLSQVKGISDSDIILSTAVYAFFAIFFPILVTIVVEKIGKRKSVFIGNIFNCLYVIFIMMSNNIIYLIFAEFISAIAFSLKNATESPILDHSIPKSKRKKEIFSHIDAKGYSKYCYFSAIATVIAGYLYNWNPYLPIVICLLFAIFGMILSYNFIDMEELEETQEQENIGFKECIENVKDGFSFIFKSKRLKALLIMGGAIWGILCLYSNYQATLLKNMMVPAEYIGIILAIFDLMKGVGSQKANIVHRKFRNKTLSCLLFVCTFGAIIAGLVAIFRITFSLQILLICITYFSRAFVYGIFSIVKKRYMGNFATERILPKIYSVDNIIMNIMRMLIEFLGTLILVATDIQYAMIVSGILFSLIGIILVFYMKSRIGLKPEQYDEKDIIKQTLEIR